MKTEQLKEEAIIWLDTQKINSENIGAIRWGLMMPFESEWNSFIREETAIRENKPQ